MPPSRKPPASGKKNLGELQVRTANENKESLEALVGAEYTTITRDGMELKINKVWARECSKDTQETVFGLTEANMKGMYEMSNWGWNESQKRKELLGTTSQYLIVTDKESTIRGFVHFRFDLDFGLPVIYCYEIQLVTDMQRKGIGAHLMAILQILADKFRMRKVVLTVFKHNDTALSFYQKKLAFRMDSTNPKENEYDYVILCKKVEKV